MTTSDIELHSGAEHPATEPHAANVAGRLNWLRAGVLGANDGIVSTAGLVVGVAGATAAREVIFTAGMAGLVAGAVSMALGEYVSVSTQRDSQRALLEQERQELRDTPEAELRELTGLYAAKGLSQQTARAVAEELTEHDALAAHLDVELGINPDDLSNPWQAALSSAVAFTAGAVIPLIAILLPPASARVPVAFFSVLLALALTGTVSSVLSGARKTRAIFASCSVERLQCSSPTASVKWWVLHGDDADAEQVGSQELHIFENYADMCCPVRFRDDRFEPTQ